MIWSDNSDIRNEKVWDLYNLNWISLRLQIKMIICNPYTI